MVGRWPQSVSLARLVALTALINDRQDVLSLSFFLDALLHTAEHRINDPAFIRLGPPHDLLAPADYLLFSFPDGAADSEHPAHDGYICFWELRDVCKSRPDHLVVVARTTDYCGRG